MELSGSMPPAANTDHGSPEVGENWRILAGILAVVLLLIAALMVYLGVDLSDTPLENEVRLQDIPRSGTVTVYEGSETGKTLTILAFIVSGALAGLAGVFAAAIAITARANRWVWLLLGPAVLIGATAVVLNQV